MENQLEKRRELDASIPNQLGADQILEDEKIAELQEKISESEQKLLQKEDQETAHVAKISKLENPLKVAERKPDEPVAVETVFLKKKISELEQKLLQKEDQETAHVAKISKLENSLKVAKRKTDEPVAVEKKKISELEQKLLQKEDQETAHVAKISKLENSLKVAKRKTDELEAVEKAFLKELENYEQIRGDCGIVGPKQIGFFNIEEDPSMKGLNLADDFMRFWEARVKDPHFDACISADDGEGNMKYVIRGDHAELSQLRKSYGDAVYNAVCNVYLQVMEWGAGESVLWNYRENRKASAIDVVVYCTLEISPLRR